MAEINLQPVEAAVVTLREKYADLVFATNLELTVNGTRGILDVRIRRSSNPEDAWTLSIIVPNDMATEKQYQQHIENFVRSRFGIRD